VAHKESLSVGEQVIPPSITRYSVGTIALGSTSLSIQADNDWPKRLSACLDHASVTLFKSHLRASDGITRAGMTKFAGLPPWAKIGGFRFKINNSVEPEKGQVDQAPCQKYNSWQFSSCCQDNRLHGACTCGCVPRAPVYKSDWSKVSRHLRSHSLRRQRTAGPMHR
jgi:hypothetical protein